MRLSQARRFRMISCGFLFTKDLFLDIAKIRLFHFFASAAEHTWKVIVSVLNIEEKINIQNHFYRQNRNYWLHLFGIVIHFVPDTISILSISDRLLTNAHAFLSTANFVPVSRNFFETWLASEIPNYPNGSWLIFAQNQFINFGAYITPLNHHYSAAILTYENNRFLFGTSWMIKDEPLCKWRFFVCDYVETCSDCGLDKSSLSPQQKKF